MINIVSIPVCLDQGKNSQRSACGVYLYHTDEYNRSCYRLIAYPAGNMPKHRVDIDSVTLGLSAVRMNFKDQEIHIFASRYIVDLLEEENGKFKVFPKKYVDEVNKMRSIYKTFPRVIIAQSTSNSSEYLDKVRECADKQDGTDTGTVIL